MLGILKNVTQLPEYTPVVDHLMTMKELTMDIVESTLTDKAEGMKSQHTTKVMATSSTPFCTFCGIAGHWPADCRKMQKHDALLERALQAGVPGVQGAPQRQQPKKTPGRALPTDVCRRCKQQGHWERDCPVAATGGGGGAGKKGGGGAKGRRAVAKATAAIASSA